MMKYVCEIRERTGALLQSTKLSDAEINIHLNGSLFWPKKCPTFVKGGLTIISGHVKMRGRSRGTRIWYSG